MSLREATPEEREEVDALAREIFRLVRYRTSKPHMAALALVIAAGQIAGAHTENKSPFDAKRALDVALRDAFAVGLAWLERKQAKGAL